MNTNNPPGGDLPAGTPFPGFPDPADFNDYPTGGMQVVAPITIDLDRDGTIGYLPSGSHDALLSFNGSLYSTPWVSAVDGFLAYDANHDGIVTDTSEIILTAHVDDSSVTTDLEALRSVQFDSNQDARLDSLDVSWSDLGIWRDLDADGQYDAGEYSSLSYYGIVAFDLNGIPLGGDGISADGQVILFGRFIVEYVDGTTGLAEDVAFAVAPADASAIDPQALEPLPAVESTEFVLELTTEDVVIPEAEAVGAELVAVADLVDQFVAENVVSNETLVEYQQELALTPDDSAFDANLDAGSSEPTAEAIVALDAADLATTDPADDGLGHVADVVDDFSYTV